jgi:hypothetical protein
MPISKLPPNFVINNLLLKKSNTNPIICNVTPPTNTSYDLPFVTTIEIQMNDFFVGWLGFNCTKMLVLVNTQAFLDAPINV